MKTFVILVFTVLSYANINAQDQYKFTGTFSGLTDEYYFNFKDADNKITVFNEIDNEVEADLFDEETVGKKFEITWEKMTIELTDENGEPTGETEQGKRIVGMKEVPTKKV
ncbi:hypothetical protein UMM65_13520 [Aureibaculum sp. 2210JD6-5]|uniref:hypothetical protein n=1 Tax=Aureibaculum sp. 2210JD6-5 TaxID=3103957 RepID=UPI002AADDECF|nr:hypothetical protein [Aureibaculum sp. 2210JD6-5]MDY7396264.1 hypothetical protein [Aureibaculum sp. 2210JD6-5]